MKNGESKLYLLNNIMMIDCYYFNKTEENQKQPQHCDRFAGIFTPVQEITVGFVIPYCFWKINYVLFTQQVNSTDNK
jgi:hypothetical protein